jgi:hypothetical protein
MNAAPASATGLEVGTGSEPDSVRAEQLILLKEAWRDLL